MDALVKHVDRSRVHFNKRCTGVTSSSTSSESKELAIHFADGSTVRADIVIGADGIKSAVRGAVTGRDANESITYSNTSCYRGLVPMERVRAAGIETDFTRRPMCYVGPGKVIFALDILILDHAENASSARCRSRSECG